MMNMMLFEQVLVRPVMTRVLSHSYDKHRDPFKAFLRTACLGNSIIPRLYRSTRLSATYAQKGHVQYLNQLSKGFNISPQKDFVLPILGENLKHWYQQNLDINVRKDFFEADFSLFDSFCELTDLKLEAAKDVWVYGHKKDFNLKLGETYNFVEISVEDIEADFIEILEKKMLISPEKPLIYLFYSSENDSRLKYKSRSKELLEMGKRLTQSYSCFKLLKLDLTEYHPAETDLHPYHYSVSTKVELAKKMDLILREFGIKSNRYTTRL
jgi:hypothetical protein